jgi:hypothetical protein
MFDADTWRIFTDGVEQKDAEGKIIHKQWNEYPLNMQVIVGLFCKAAGYDYSGWFVPSVVEALNDDELTALVRRLDTTRSMSGVYQLSFPVLARLRELGFCATDMDPDPDQPQDEEQEDEQGDTGGEPGESEDQAESGEPTEGESGTGDPSSQGDSGGQDPEESGEERGSDDGGPGTPSDEEPDSGSASAESDADGGGEADSEEAADEADGDSASRGDGEVTDASDDLPRDEDESGDGDESSRSEHGDDSDSDRQQEGDDDSVSGSGDGEDVQEPDESNATGPSSSDPARSSEDAGDGEGSESDGAGGNTGLDGESASPDDTSESGVDSDEDTNPDGEVDTPSPDGEGDLTTPDDSEPIDTGADDGTGGVQIIEKEEYDDLPMGTAEDAKVGLLKWGDHDEKPKSVEETYDEQAVDRAIVQGIYFETPSRNIYGVREHRFDQHVIVNGTDMSTAWDQSKYMSMGFTRKSLGVDGDFDVPEKILGPALLAMRVAFADNKRGHELRHRKTGRVDARVLGKRASLGDERLFKKKVLPGKKSYFVLIGMDVSGSTVGVNIAIEKQAVFAQATLLSRMGISFAIYAHSGNYHTPNMGRREGLDLDIYFIKEADEVWDTRAQERLVALGPDSANLDGHTLEYYRKRLDEVQATDKIILYYTDGKMPAENEAEELEILQREIRLCKQRKYTLLGVGIRTDSPVRHGLDTVQLDDEGDVVKVVKHLEKRLLET